MSVSILIFSSLYAYQISKTAFLLKIFITNSSFSITISPFQYAFKCFTVYFNFISDLYLTSSFMHTIPEVKIMPDLLKILATTTGSFIALFILTKLMGKRQLSQLSTFDYIIGITIGSIAGDMATNIDGPFYRPLLAMTLYAAFSILIAIAITKSLALRKKIEGTPVILFDCGKMYKENFRKNKLDLDEFLMLCRDKGFFNLKDVQTIILEENGRLSILPKSSQRPTIPKDFDLCPAQDGLVTNLIMDGDIMEINLTMCNHDKQWLLEQITKQGAKQLKDVFLATIDNNDNLSVFINYHDFNIKNSNKLIGK